MDEPDPLSDFSYIPGTRDTFTSACKVVCEADSKDGGEVKWIVYLPSRLLWTPEGMAHLFRLAHSWLASPQEFPGDDDIENTWDSFHIVSIKELKRIQVLDVAWDEPDGKEDVSS